MQYLLGEFRLATFNCGTLELESVEEICALGYDQSLVKRIINLVNKNEYKRKQAAPVIRVSPKAFGMGRRMPIVANYTC
jgi:NAD+ synthase (glutamine-hydrolysing)